MSEAKSALSGAAFSGLVGVRDEGPRGMITLRGDLGAEAVKGAVEKAVGLGVPERRRVLFEGDTGVAWMSPDELLVMVPYDAVAGALEGMESALDGTHSLSLDVSDARTVLALDGEGRAIREVLAKLTPADLHPEAFAVGEVRRSRLAQVPAAFWFRSEDRLELVCFRSVSDYVFGLLCNAAKEGSAVGYF